MFITAIGGLFFAKNPTVLKGVVISATFLQIIAYAIVGYLVLIMKFPKISPKFGFITIFLLGLGATILTVILPSNPFLEPNGSINWDIHPIPGSLRIFISFITFLPLGIIFIQQALKSKTLEMRNKAIGLGGLVIAGLIMIPFHLLFSKVLKLGAIGSDLSLGIYGISLLILLFLTRKPRSEEKYIPPPPFPKIPW